MKKMKFKKDDIVTTHCGKVGKVIDITKQQMGTYKWNEITVRWLNKEESCIHEDLLDLLDDMIKKRVEALDKLEDKKEKAIQL